MPKTIKQIADELGVSKQRVYRFIKQNCIMKHIRIVSMIRSVMRSLNCCGKN